VIKHGKTVALSSQPATDPKLPSPAASSRRFPRLANVPAGTLVTGGALYIVGSRHLGYHSNLAWLFGGVEKTAATLRFVILKARK
jgi:hypothetical protein